MRKVFRCAPFRRSLPLTLTLVVAVACVCFLFLCPLLGSPGPSFSHGAAAIKLNFVQFWLSVNIIFSASRSVSRSVSPTLPPTTTPIFDTYFLWYIFVLKWGDRCAATHWNCRFWCRFRSAFTPFHLKSMKKIHKMYQK